MEKVLKQFSISLDTKRSTSNRDFEVVHGDNGNVLEITLTDDGQPVDLSESFILAVFSKSDGRTAAQDNHGNGITVDEEQSNRIYVELYTTSFAPGLVECELQVYSGEEHRTLTTTAKFNFMCRLGIANKTTIAETDEWPVLIEMLDRVDGAEEELHLLNEETAQAAYEAHTAANRANEAGAHAESINAEMEANEAQRVTAENSRLSAELERINAESGRRTQELQRIAAEQVRIEDEGQRQVAEALRQGAESARQTAESIRSASEEARVNAEAIRLSAETQRQEAENERLDAEGARQAAESERSNAEQERISNENARIFAETQRQSDESARTIAETARIDAETLRAADEAQRLIAESERVSAELERIAHDEAFIVWEDYDNERGYVPLNKVSYGGSSYLCILDAQGVAPPNPSYWLLIAAKGADGEGAGDMLKSTYDKTDAGVVDDSQRLGGRLASEYLTAETDPTVPDWAKAPEKPSYTLEELGAGDMLKSTYDTTDSGTVDDADRLGGRLAEDYLTQETDPTVPDWAKAPEKPSYTAEEVGAAAITHAEQHATGGGDAITPADIGAAEPSIALEAVLMAGGWVDKQQTLAVSGITPYTNCIIGIADMATENERSAARKALLFASEVSEDSITVLADGETPETNIPCTILVVR